MATLVRWEPFRELAALQNDMGRLMSTFVGEGQPGGENGQRSWMPAVDVWEDENELVYAFDLPGIPEDKISVEYDEGALTVSGERVREETTEGDRFYRFERRFGSFSRTVGLPQGVSEDGIRAGIISLTGHPHEPAGMPAVRPTPPTGDSHGHRRY